MKTTRASLHLISLLPATLLLAAACAGPADMETNEEASASELDVTALGASRAHLLPLPDASRARPKTSQDGFDWGGQGGYNFTHHGGPVISNVKVVTVFWNSHVPNQGKLNSFYQAIVQSPHMDWLKEYNTDKQSIGRGSFLASYVDTGAPASTSLKDPDIQKELGRLIDTGKVPAPDADTLYMVHFPAGVAIELEGSHSCQQFCAYHGTFTNDGKNVYYGVMPDFSGGCTACGGTSDKLQNTTIISSHELVEAITDPAIGIANAKNDASFLAWYDDQNGEIGDVCQSDAGEVAGWMVQAEYSMKAGACVVTASDAGHGNQGGPGFPNWP
ncbi:hemagglutinin protein [Minicystis rosea]|nr:hemagglutinin protein [Minicystis rosea]